MRISRLVIEANQNTVSVAFHPRLTVVAGVPAAIRTTLAEEMVGGLGSDRSGAHLELASDAGKQFTVFRPTGGPHRVIESESGNDLTDAYRSESGEIDVFGHYGIDKAKARSLIRLDRNAVTTGPPPCADVARLSEIHQAELWSVAARVRITDEEFRLLSSEAESNTEDAALVARVEKHHQTSESAIERQRLIQQSLIRVAGFTFLVALPVALISPTSTLPLIGIGAITVLLALVYKARVDAARRSEASALADAGSDSYLGFVVKRVDGMMHEGVSRRRLATAAEDHRAAAISWTRLAGDVNVDWAFAHQGEIDSVARLRHQMSALAQASPTATDLDDQTATLAQGVMAHVAHLRRVGTTGESLPLILDDPFDGIDSATKHSILDLLARSAGQPQIILLTDQDDVADWAREEARTGAVSLVEALTSVAPGTQATTMAV